jgi:hypothetical protein
MSAELAARDAALQAAIESRRQLFGRIDVSSVPGRTIFTGDSDRKCSGRIQRRLDRCSLGNIP